MFTKVLFILFIFIVPIIFIVILKLYYIIIPGEEIGQISDWISFSGGYIGALVALGGIWLQINYNENKLKKDIKLYLLETIKYNLNKLNSEKFKLSILSMLSLTKDTVALDIEDRKVFIQIDLNSSFELTSLALKLRINSEIQDINLSIEYLEEMKCLLKKSTLNDDFFYSLKTKLSETEYLEAYNIITYISNNIDKYIYFISTSKDNKYINEDIGKFEEFLSKDSEFINNNFKNRFKEYKIKDENYIIYLFELLCINLDNLSDRLERKHLLRKINIPKLLEKEQGNNSNEELNEMSIFLRKKKLEIRHTIKSITELERKLKDLKCKIK